MLSWESHLVTPVLHSDVTQPYGCVPRPKGGWDIQSSWLGIYCCSQENQSSIRQDVGMDTELQSVFSHVCSVGLQKLSGWLSQVLPAWTHRVRLSSLGSPSHLLSQRKVLRAPVFLDPVNQFEVALRVPLTATTTGTQPEGGGEDSRRALPAFLTSLPTRGSQGRIL